MEIINKYEIPVIEDNPYGELRYEGDFLPALKSMDTKGLVVFLGTFSKILAPAIAWAGSVQTTKFCRSTTSWRRLPLCRLPPSA